MTVDAFADLVGAKFEKRVVARYITLRTYFGEPVPYPERKGKQYSDKWCQQWVEAIHAAHTKYGLPCDFSQEQIHAAHEDIGELLHLGVAYPALRTTPTTPKERMPELSNDQLILADMCIGYRPRMCLWQSEVQDALF